MITRQFISQRSLTLAALLIAPCNSYTMLRNATPLRTAALASMHRTPAIAAFTLHTPAQRSSFGRQFSSNLERDEFFEQAWKRGVKAEFAQLRAEEKTSTSAQEPEKRGLLTPEQEQKIRKDLWETFTQHRDEPEVWVSATQAALDAGMNPNALLSKNHLPLLHIAIVHNQNDTALLAIERGANMHLQDHRGMYPLHIASVRGNADMVAELLKRNVNIHARTHNEQTALASAAWCTEPKVVELLVNAKADVTTRDNEQQTPVHTGLRKIADLIRSKDASDLQNILPGHLAVLEALLKAKVPVDAQDKDGDTALHFAAHIQYPNAAQLLLKHNASTEIKNNLSFTPIYGAINDAENLRLLLDHKANPHVTCNNNATPLHMAASLGDEKTVQILLDQGVDINAADNDGDTSLHLAAMANNLKTMAALITNKADINAKNNNGVTPLEKAFRHSERVRVRILEAIADHEAKKDQQ